MVPTEHEEQCTLVDYLELKNIKFTSIPNSTYTKSWKQKSKNKAEGLRPGLPDMLVIIKNHLVFIELKRVKGGRVSEHQESWIAALNGCEAVQAFVCKGAQEAMDLIERLEKAHK